MIVFSIYYFYNGNLSHGTSTCGLWTIRSHLSPSSSFRLDGLLGLIVSLVYSFFPHFYSRPPSSFFDSVRDSYDNHDRLADDLTVSLSLALCSNNEFTDITFLVGKLNITVKSSTALFYSSSKCI